MLSRMLFRTWSRVTGASLPRLSTLDRYWRSLDKEEHGQLQKGS